jgi:hypothetical protein
MALFSKIENYSLDLNLLSCGPFNKLMYWLGASWKITIINYWKIFLSLSLN